MCRFANFGEQNLSAWEAVSHSAHGISLWSHVLTCVLSDYTASSPLKCQSAHQDAAISSIMAI